MEKMLGLLPHDTIPCWLFQFIFLQKLPEVLRCKLARLDQEFLGTCNFYILSFATIALPLTKALASKLKEALSSGTLLHHPVSGAAISLLTDASATSLGAVHQLSPPEASEDAFKDASNTSNTSDASDSSDASDVVHQLSTPEASKDAFNDASNASDASDASNSSDASDASIASDVQAPPAVVQASCSIQSSALTSQQPVLGGSSVETSFLMSPLRSTINNQQSTIHIRGPLMYCYCLHYC